MRLPPQCINSTGPAANPGDYEITLNPDTAPYNSPVLTFITAVDATPWTIGEAVCVVWEANPDTEANYACEISSNLSQTSFDTSHGIVTPRPMTPGRYGLHTWNPTTLVRSKTAYFTFT